MKNCFCFSPRDFRLKLVRACEDFPAAGPAAATTLGSAHWDPSWLEIKHLLGKSLPTAALSNTIRNSTDQILNENRFCLCNELEMWPHGRRKANTVSLNSTSFARGKKWGLSLRSAARTVIHWEQFPFLHTLFQTKTTLLNRNCHFNLMYQKFRSRKSLSSMSQPPADPVGRRKY